jgi:signal transduction histidine kinase
MIDDLVDTARLQMGDALPLDRRQVDTAVLARRVADAHQRTTERHRIVVDASLDAPAGFWDGARLERVLDNLVANAVKYSPAGGDVVVRVRREGGAAVVSVIDHGLGIPSADIPRVFDRFHRGANVQGRISGTGIGLASVRQIVEQHGGTVAVESREGCGSTFTIRLPLDETGDPPQRADA